MISSCSFRGILSNKLHSILPIENGEESSVFVGKYCINQVQSILESITTGTERFELCSEYCSFPIMPFPTKVRASSLFEWVLEFIGIKVLRRDLITDALNGIIFYIVN